MSERETIALLGGYSLRTDENKADWMKIIAPDGGMISMMPAAKARAFAATLQPPAVSVDGEFRWALDEIDVLANKLCGFGYPQAMTFLGRTEHSDAYVRAVMARRALASSTQPEAAGQADLVSYIKRQWAWSKETFGPALRTKGVIDHIRKELREIEAQPHDLSEWVDVIILAMDGFWRHGGQPDDLLPRMQAKQDKNFARQWPDWRAMSEDSAIEHDRSGEAAAPQPAIPAGDASAPEKPIVFSDLTGRQKVIAETLFDFGGSGGGADDTLVDMFASICCGQAVAIDKALAGDASGDVDVALKEVERVCRIIEPNLFSDDPATAHREASPYKVEYARKLIRDKVTEIARALANPSATRRQEDAGAGLDAKEEVVRGVAASLAAAISLLERGGRKAAPSNNMFEQMLDDYRESLDMLRALYAAPTPPTDKAGSAVGWRDEAGSGLETLQAEVLRLREEADGDFVQAAIRVMRANPAFKARDYAATGITAEDFESFFAEDMNEAWQQAKVLGERLARSEELADKFKQQVVDTCSRAEKAEATGWNAAIGTAASAAKGWGIGYHDQQSEGARAAHEIERCILALKSETPTTATVKSRDGGERG